MDYKSISAGELSSMLEVQRSNISHILNGRNKPGASFIEKLLVTFPDLNARWLFTGEGEMTEGQEKVIEQTALDLPDVPKTVTSEIPFNQALTSGPDTKSEEIRIEKIVFFYSDGSFKDFHSK